MLGIISRLKLYAAVMAGFVALLVGVFFKGKAAARSEARKKLLAQVQEAKEIEDDVEASSDDSITDRFDNWRVRDTLRPIASV